MSSVITHWLTLSCMLFIFARYDMFSTIFNILIPNLNSFKVRERHVGPYFNSLKRKAKAPNAKTIVGGSMAMLLL